MLARLMWCLEQDDIIGNHYWEHEHWKTAWRHEVLFFDKIFLKTPRQIPASASIDDCPWPAQDVESNLEGLFDDLLA